MRVDAGGTEHDDGVADALILELDERVDVFRDNANGARRSAGEKFGIFVGGFRGVLGLRALTVWHGNFSIQDALRL